MAASSSQSETMKAQCSLDNPKDCYPETSVPVLHVTLLGDEWSSSTGGLSTINRELAIHLSNHSAVKVSLLVPEGACNYEEKNEAHTYGITIVEAKRRAACDRLVWLSSPPKDHIMDVVVGHGVKLGLQVQFIQDSAQFPNCKWVQMVHTAPEDLSRYKCYTDSISKGETKHESEVELCKLADLVVPVGPRLKEVYSSYLQRCKTDEDVLCITPGLFQREFGDLVAKKDPNEDGEFKVLLFGRGDDEDFELKGYNIAAQAFTDQRLKNKPYHLLFVGAPEGKQEEVREKLLQLGIAEAQLTVRKFIQSREKLKDLLCEADLAIMPSKSEGFGLVALEALSAGLPILVGCRSGFAKALESVPHGYSCVINSDDPAEWAKATEAVRIRHGMRLQEIKSLRESYGKMYSWKEQCEALVKRMWEMVNGPCTERANKQRTNSIERRSSKKKATAAAGDQTEKSANNEWQISRKLKTSGSSSNPDVSTKHCFLELNDEQRNIVHETLARQIQLYIQYRQISTEEGVSGLIEHIKKTYNLALESVGQGSLKITFRCPSLESLERLWRDCQSGHLNSIAKRYLVTEDMKKKLNLENVKLKTTIEEQNYRICKKILTENLCKSAVLPVSSDFSSSTDSDQKAPSLPTDTSPDVSPDRTHMERAEKAKTMASKGPQYSISTGVDFVKEVHKTRSTRCPEHSDQEFRYFDEDCGRVICIDCHTLNHNGHKCVTLAEAASKSRKEMEALVTKASSQAEKIKAAEAEVKKAAAFMKKASDERRAEIQGFFRALHAALSDREHVLMDRLVGLLQHKESILREQLDRLQVNQTFLDSVVQQANASIQSPSDVHFLLSLSDIVTTIQTEESYSLVLEPEAQFLPEFGKQEKSPFSDKAGFLSPLSESLVEAIERAGAISDRSTCAEKVTAIGPGTIGANPGRKATFTITSRDSQNCQRELGGDVYVAKLKAKEGGPEYKVDVEDQDDGTYLAEYTVPNKFPPPCGQYTLSVCLRGAHIKGSPFSVQVTRPWHVLKRAQKDTSNH